jgi:hypothetical protein
LTRDPNRLTRDLNGITREVNRITREVNRMDRESNRITREVNRMDRDFNRMTREFNRLPQALHLKSLLTNRRRILKSNELSRCSRKTSVRALRSETILNPAPYKHSVPTGLSTEVRD